MALSIEYDLGCVQPRKHKKIRSPLTRLCLTHRRSFPCYFYTCLILSVAFPVRFFLKEIQAGEALISSGEIDEGVTHLANAVVVCGQPTQLLQVRAR